MDTRLTRQLIYSLLLLFVLVFVLAVISLRHRDKYDSGYPKGEANEESTPSK